MKYFKISVNPYIYWMEETLRKSEDELLNKISSIFVLWNWLKEVKPSFLNWMETWISFEYKWQYNSLIFYINTPIHDISTVTTYIQSIFPVSTVQEVEYESLLIKDKIIKNERKKYLFNDNYKLRKNTVIFSSNDYSSIITSKSRKIDTFHSILSLLSWLNDWYFSRYQMTIVPANRYWKEKIQKRDLLIQNYKEAKWIFNKEEKKQSASYDKNILDLIWRDKWNSSRWYFVILRYFFIWDKESILDNKINWINDIISGLTFDKSKVQFLDEKKDFLYNYYNSILLPIAISKWSLMVDHELNTIIHPPIPNNIKIQNLDTQLFQKLPIPAELIISKKELLGDEITYWINDYGWIENLFTLNNDARYRHIYALWKSWVWKSTLLHTAIMQDIYNWNWVCVIDPHWDLIDDIMENFPDPRNPKYKDRYKELIYIDFWDTEQSVWLNILEAENEHEETKVVNSFMSLLKKMFPDSWESLWPYFEDYVRNVCRTIMRVKDLYKPTLNDIIRLLQSEEYRAHAVSYLDPEKDIDLINFWINHENQTWEDSQSQNKDEIVPHIRTKFAPFLSNKYVKNVTWQEDSTINFFDAINSNKIILVKLSKWSVWEENMVILWLILITKLLNDVFKREKIPKNERKPFFLYVDEFQNFITKEFENIFSEARKYNFWITVANQYLWQLIENRTKDDRVLKSVIGNAWTFIAFKVWSDDVQKLEEHYWNKQLLPKESFSNIEKYYAYVQTWGSSNILKTLSPFTIKTLVSDKPKILVRDTNWKIIRNKENNYKWTVDREVINKIINYSKKIYTRKSNVIDEHDSLFVKYFSEEE